MCTLYVKHFVGLIVCIQLYWQCCCNQLHLHILLNIYIVKLRVTMICTHIFPHSDIIGWPLHDAAFVHMNAVFHQEYIHNLSNRPVLHIIFNPECLTVCHLWTTCKSNNRGECLLIGLTNIIITWTSIGLILNNNSNSQVVCILVWLLT